MKDFGNSPVILLDRQYRMNPQIASFPNEYIYNGRIQDDVYVVFLYIWSILTISMIISIMLAFDTFLFYLTFYTLNFIRIT